MGFVATWVNDKIQNKQLINKVVEETHAKLFNKDPVLNKYFPIMEYNDPSFLGMLINNNVPIASVIAPEGKVPTIRPNDFTQVVSEFSKLGFDAPYGEKIQDKLKILFNSGQLRSANLQTIKMRSGETIPGVNDNLASMILRKPQSLVMGVHETMRIWSWQIAQTGGIDWTDHRTGISFNITWIDPLASYNHFPAALTNTGSGNPEGSVVWTDTVNADGLETLKIDLTTYYDTNGFFPDSIQMSRSLLGLLIRQDKIAAQVNNLGNAMANVSSRLNGKVIERMINEQLTTEGIAINVYDEQYTLDESDNRTRFLDSRRYTFMKEGMGERAFGPTAESQQDLQMERKFDSGYGKPGVWHRVFTDPTDVTLDICQVRAKGMVIAMNPKLLFSRQVIA